MLVAVCMPVLASQHTPIRLVPLPDHAIQPLLMASGGKVHLVYFQKESAGTRFGYLEYAVFDQTQNRFDHISRVHPKRMRHNDQVGMADAAVDEQGRVHVAWFQNKPLGYFYARLQSNGTTFERPTAVVQKHLQGVEVGPSIAATGDQVNIAWHAGDMANEQQRHVYHSV